MRREFPCGPASKNLHSHRRAAADCVDGYALLLPPIVIGIAPLLLVGLVIHPLEHKITSNADS
jgi:hypothetical protein